MAKWTADSVGPGWKKLVQPLIDLCELYNIEILQIKEKLAGLRFYHKQDDRINAIVRAAESASYHTCEDCGEAGVIRWDAEGPIYKATRVTLPSGYWIKTLCAPCLEKRSKA